jgi:hypothetical protein
MPPDDGTPIDRFFAAHCDADILLCLRQVFFARQKNDAAWLSAETPLVNALYRATIVEDDLVQDGWTRFAETLRVGTIAEFLDALRFFHARFALEVQRRAENPDRFLDEARLDADPVQDYVVEAGQLLTDEVARAVRAHRESLLHLLPSMEAHAQANLATREAMQGKPAWRAAPRAHR